MEDKQKTLYEPNKYCIQDVTTIYIGAKYSLGEILDAEEIPFKLRLLVERDIMPKADAQDSLESHLYYLEPDSFLVKLYEQLKAKVKINIIEEKRSLLGKAKKMYTTQNVSVKKLAEMNFAEKQKKGVVVQELMVSKLSLLGM
ncbi:MAG: hypothetical protein K6G30_14290 [Acetatifactor sp.]|nr:hypothetical protein [Acetatifactor sp.]